MQEGNNRKDQMDYTHGQIATSIFIHIKTVTEAVNSFYLEPMKAFYLILLLIHLPKETDKIPNINSFHI